MRKTGFSLIQSVHSCVLLFIENKCRLLFIENACFESIFEFLGSVGTVIRGKLD